MQKIVLVRMAIHIFVLAPQPLTMVLNLGYEEGDHSDLLNKMETFWSLTLLKNSRQCSPFLKTVGGILPRSSEINETI